jgi:hypothetical protein
VTIDDESVLTPSTRTAIGNLFVWVSGLDAIGVLRKRGIPVMVIKSLPQVEALYGDAGGRLTGDVDIVVPASRLVEAYTTLVDLGWRLHDVHRLKTLTQARGADNAIRAGSWHFVTPEGHPVRSAIDLHSDDPEAGDKSAINPELWRAASRVEIDGVDIFVASAEDRLMILCCHAVRSSLDDRILADIRRALADPRLQWERVAERATAAGLCTAVVVTCSLALGASRADPAMWASQGAFRSTMRSRLLIHLFERWRPNPSRGAENRLVLALVTDRLARRLRYLRSGLVPSREEVGAAHFDHLPTWPEYASWHLALLVYRAKLIVSWFRRSGGSPAA